MKTAVRRVLLMSALMSPGALYALGLGEIRLNSALNQPFDAEIELVSATQEDLGALRAALASGETFTRYGLDRPAYLADFNFRVAKGSGGKDVLRVTSPRPVTEPFVTLLVEANWPRGRLLREYTVLLDPPVFTPGPAASETVATPRVTSGGATSVTTAEPVARATAEPARPVAEPARTTPAAPVTAPTERAPGIAPGGTYHVRPNDTLYRIASAVNPGSRSDVNRAMVSIYQNNQQAFEGNINLLRSGSTLQIPDASAIQAVSVAAASAEVSRQYEAWRNASAAAADTGHLRLVTPEEGTTAPSTSVAAGTTAATDLESRVKQLEAELAEARRLLEVRNAELATLQGGAAAVDGTAAPTADGGTAPAADGAPTEPAATTAAEPKEEPAAQPATPPQKAPPAEPPAPTLFERIQEYWWVLLGLLAAGLGIVLFQRLRRERGAVDENLEEALGRSSDLRTTSKFTPRARESDGFVVEEKRAAEPVRAAAPVAPVVVAAAPALAPTRKTVTVEDTMTGDATGTTEPSDPLAEADFHMAYGLYDQAADLVQLAIKREPARRELRLKLLEIFFVWGNRDRFTALAQELHATRNQAPAGEWDKVLIMGKQIAPELPIFAGAPSGVDSLDMELHGATQTLDLDMSDLPLGTMSPDLDLSESTTATTVVADTASTGLDFVFDDETLHDTSEMQVPPTIETPRVSGEETLAGDTQELTVDNLGLDVDALRDLAALEDDTLLNTASLDMASIPVDETVETRAAKAAQALHGDEDEEHDLLSSTSMLGTLDDVTAVMEPGVIDLSETTGELPSLDDTSSTTGITRRIDFDAGEPPTMSEVGTKLDLARAYMDMGDPEGARSILDEVLTEGNGAQEQEAERLIANLP